MSSTSEDENRRKQTSPPSVVSAYWCPEHEPQSLTSIVQDLRCSASDIYRSAAAFQRELRDRIESRKNRRNRGGKLRLSAQRETVPALSFDLEPPTAHEGAPLTVAGVKRLENDSQTLIENVNE
nr:hypothetical protein Iba_chr12dCG14780 [Ipomoea batatas]